MRKIFTLGIMLLFIGMTISSTTGINLEKKSIKPMSFGNILYVGGNGPGNYSTIQEAIDNATDGDTVFVYNGTYGLAHHRIYINKSIKLIGENKFNTIINRGGIEIVTSKVHISCFTVHNESGIFIGSFEGEAVNNNTVYNNILKLNVDDILPGGITISNSSYNNVSDNSFLNCGLYVYDSYNNIVDNNTVNEKPLVYYEDVSDKIIDWAGQIILSHCSNITVKNLQISNTTAGIQLINCVDCYILDNMLIYNAFFGGLYLFNSNNNTISGNIISNNLIGAYLAYSRFNNISGNSFENEVANIGLESSSNNIFSSNNFKYSHRSENIFTIDSDNKWYGNFWDRSRILPVIIWGFKIIRFFKFTFLIPSVDIDWNPASEPYDIEV